MKIEFSADKIYHNFSQRNSKIMQICKISTDVRCTFKINQILKYQTHQFSANFNLFFITLHLRSGSYNVNCMNVSDWLLKFSRAVPRNAVAMTVNHKQEALCEIVLFLDTDSPRPGLSSTQAKTTEGKFSRPHGGRNHLIKRYKF